MSKLVKNHQLNEMEFWNTAKDVFDSLVQNICTKAAEYQENNILKVLQPELLVHIFKFLPASDLFSVRLVCKKFNEAATCPQVFQLDLQESDLQLEQLQLELLLPLLKNIISIKICNTEEKDAEELEKFFKKLEEQCTSLKILTISDSYIPANITLENIVEKLSELIIINVDFKHAVYFFKTSPENSVYRNLEKLVLYNCTGIEEDEAPFEAFSKAPMRKLRELTMSDVSVIGDPDFLHLKESMTNVTTLFINDDALTVEAFEQLEPKKLTSLDVTFTQTNDDWLVPMRKFLELETLSISNINIVDATSTITFKKLNKIKSLTITDCNFGNLTVSAIVSQLPNLITLKMRPLEDGIITDMALNNVVVHNHLETIDLDRVQFRGFSLRQIAQFAPKLKELKLIISAAEDDDMDVFKDGFAQLTKLNLSGLRITDVGIEKLQPRLGLLTDIELESRFVTGAGIASILPSLTSVERFNIEFGEPQSSIKLNEWKQNYDLLSFSGANITKEMMTSFSKRFQDVKFALRFDNVIALGAAELRHFAETQPGINTLIINTCPVNDEMAALLLKDFTGLIILILSGCQLTRDSLLKLFESLANRKIDLITIESEILLQEETLIEILPLFANVVNIIVHTLDYEKTLTINNNPNEPKEISFLGLDHVCDEMLEKVIRLYKEIEILTIFDAGVTAKGIEDIAVHLTKLTSLKIKSIIMGDETVEVIGSHFPCLKILSIDGERFTDVSLEALGKKHLESLESLTIINSGITDEGVKKIVPQLTAVNTLDLYSKNKNVTAELLAYMKKTYPNITHTEPEAEEDVEEQNDGEQRAEQVQPEDGLNEIAVEPVEMDVGENEVAEEPIQPQVQNLVEDVPVQNQPEELYEVVAHEDQLEGGNDVDVEPQPPTPSQLNEGETERQTPKEQNRVVEEQGQPERKNIENVERSPSVEENGMFM